MAGAFTVVWQMVQNQYICMANETKLYGKRYINVGQTTHNMDGKRPGV